AKRLESQESAKYVNAFARFNHVNWSEFDPSFVSSYPTFYSLLCRKMIQKQPSKTEKDSITCPVDGRVVTYQTLQDCQDLWIRGSKFTMDKLLAGAIPPSLTERIGNVNKWAILGARITSSEYLGVHMPYPGKILHVFEKDGACYCLTPIVLSQEVNVLTDNTRTILMVEADIGIMIIVLFNSLDAYSCQIPHKIGDEVKKGELLAFYELIQ
ncbi:phosphatidylserine decarboxylase, partial [Reticulomyxa filosa]